MKSFGRCTSAATSAGLKQKRAFVRWGLSHDALTISEAKLRRLRNGSFFFLLGVGVIKDGKLVTREWTPLLRAIVQKALGRSETGFVFVGTRGHPWTVSGLQSALRRLKPGFRFRDLRPKAATDAPHNILNHSAQMLPTYLREWSSKALG